MREPRVLKGKHRQHAIQRPVLRCCSVDTERGREAPRSTSVISCSSRYLIVKTHTRTRSTATVRGLSAECPPPLWSFTQMPLGPRQKGPIVCTHVLMYAGAPWLLFRGCTRGEAPVFRGVEDDHRAERSIGRHAGVVRALRAKPTEQRLVNLITPSHQHCALTAHCTQRDLGLSQQRLAWKDPLADGGVARKTAATWLAA